MNSTKITLQVNHPGQGICLLITLDGQELWNASQAYSGLVQLDISDSDGSHLLVIEMTGKQPHHTKISVDGVIEKDHVITIDNVAFDGITLGHVFTHLAKYSHDCNGTASPIEEKFYGTMGCNGTVSLQFTTPIYLWLLENM